MSGRKGRGRRRRRQSTTPKLPTVRFPVGTEVVIKATGETGVVERLRGRRMSRYEVGGMTYRAWELEASADAPREDAIEP